MGAVAALLYLSRKGVSQHSIAGIYDSPYSSLVDLVDNISNQKTILPGFVVDVVID